MGLVTEDVTHVLVDKKSIVARFSSIEAKKKILDNDDIEDRKRRMRNKIGVLNINYGDNERSVSYGMSFESYKAYLSQDPNLSLSINNTEKLVP